jgi:hypothetical protein
MLPVVHNSDGCTTQGPLGSIGVSSVTERVEHNFVSEHIVAQAIFSPPDAPLSFAGFQAFEFFDGMLSSSPVRVFHEDGNQFLEGFK